MEESGGTDPVVLPESLLARYRKFSLYNSPYPAHDRACAVDLYPASNAAVSPVAGEVLDTRTVGCPDREYAVDHDHLIVIDTGEYVARVLHVDPAVEAGDEVAVGDALGELVRSGFFGRWVDNHVHLEFREHGKNHYRASGSLPLVADAAVTALPWDGAGIVVAPRGDRDEVDDGRLAVGDPVECLADHVADGLAEGRRAFDRDDESRLGACHRPVTPSGASEDCPNVILVLVGDSRGRLKTILISTVG